MGAIAAAALLLDAILVLVMFPYHTDKPEKITFRPTAVDQQFYNRTYTEDEGQLRYVQIARRAAQQAQVEKNVADFVQTYHLQNARVLDVGAGSGLLQDQVKDYTGLDLSATARGYFHKPFVQADARAMPFADASFDAVWSIWVLEHVPNPEMALAEMRRILKPNGLLLLWPAWRVSPLAAQGYRARPYSDFDIGGKIIKATSGLSDSRGFEASYTFPARLIRWITYNTTQQPTAFHHRTLFPNYEQYWEADADAVNSLDRYETYLWFKSRGDLCLNCASEWDILRTQETPRMYLVIRVKPTSLIRSPNPIAVSEHVAH